MKGKFKQLLDLYLTMFKIGAVTFGGGYAMLPILERELIEKRHWTNDEELMNWYAISQATPGIIAVNVATFVGQKQMGIIGGIISTLGLVSPSLIIITVIALFIKNFAQIAWVKRALTGINVAVAAILTKAAFTFGKKAIKNVLGIILFIISFVLIFFLKVSTIWIILGSALIGVVIAGCRGEYKKQPAAETKEVSTEKNDSEAAVTEITEITSTTETAVTKNTDPLDAASQTVPENSKE